MSNRLIATVVALFMSAGAANAATLTGMEIHGSLVFSDFPQLGNCFDPVDVTGCRSPSATAPFVPDSGIQPDAIVTEADTSFPEFVFDDKGFLVVRVDVDATTISLNVENTSNIDPGDANTPFGWDVHLTDFDLPLESVSLITDPNLFPGLTATIDPDSLGIVFNFPGRNSATHDAALAAWNLNDGFSAAFAVVATPLPAALPLYASGLVLMGLFGWWRRRRALAA